MTWAEYHYIDMLLKHAEPLSIDDLVRVFNTNNNPHDHGRVARRVYEFTRHGLLYVKRQEQVRPNQYRSHHWPTELGIQLFLEADSMLLASVGIAV